MSSDPRPPRGRRADYRALVPITSRWSDNDMYGHLNNAVYYSYMDTAVTTWLVDQGFGAHGGDSMFFVAETGCRYLSEIGYPDRVTVGLRIGRLGTSSVRYEIALFRNEEDEAAAEGIFIHVHVDAATRRPSPVPPIVRDAMDGIVAR